MVVVPKQRKHVTIYHNFCSILILLCAVITLQSCDEDKDKAKWVESIEGVQVYVPNDFEEKYDIESLHCKPNQISQETHTPIPTGFILSAKNLQTGKIVKIETKFIPTFINEDSLRFDYEDGSFGFFAGTLKDRKAEGFGYDIVFSKDSTSCKLEAGYFDENKLTEGVRYKSNINDSIVSTLTDGIYKKGHLYLGYITKETITPNDTSATADIGVWNANGSMNSTFEKDLTQFIGILDSLQLDEPQDAYLGFVHRYFFWIKYKDWLYASLIILMLLSFFLAIGLSNESDDRKRLKPWSTSKAIWIWFLTGLFRGDLMYLCQGLKAGLLNIVFLGGILGSLEFIVLYGLHPEYWEYLLPSALSYGQTWVFLFCILCWVIGLFAIPYRVYKLNFKEYRHNIYESLILADEQAEYVKLHERIAEEIPKDSKIIKKIAKYAASEYADELGFVSKSFSWLTNSKVSHAKNKAEQLYLCNCEICEIAEKENEMLLPLLKFLDIERSNAYRNMILAKELIFLIKEGKDNQQDKKTDNINSIEIDMPSYSSSTPNVPEFRGEDVLTEGLNSFNSTFSTMKEIGFEDEDTLIVSIGMAGATMVFDSISQINRRRTAEREHYEYEAANFIRNINSTEKELLSIQAKMLRANEIMKALTACNEAFVKAYTPLRDYVFGTECNFSGFISHTFDKNIRRQKAINVKEDVAYLMTICSEYNKINKSKV